MNLEFRIINTVNPFLEESGDIRKTKTNWCDPNIEGEEKCSANNNLVVQNIINATNSSGRNANGEQQEPIYTITLTSSDIKVIREYNKDNYYDTIEIYCDGSGKCFNAFLYGLINGELKKYEDDEEIDSYGKLSSLNSIKDLDEESMGEENDEFIEESITEDTETDDDSDTETNTDVEPEIDIEIESNTDVNQQPQGGGSAVNGTNAPGTTSIREYFASSMARGHHIVSINYSIPDISNCYGVMNGVTYQGILGPFGRRCEVDLAEFAHPPKNWSKEVKYYYYKLNMILIDGTVYSDCVQVKVRKYGLITDRDVEFVSSGYCR